MTFLLKRLRKDSDEDFEMSDEFKRLVHTGAFSNKFQFTVNSFMQRDYPNIPAKIQRLPQLGPGSAEQH